MLSLEILVEVASLLLGFSSSGGVGVFDWDWGSGRIGRVVRDLLVLGSRHIGETVISKSNDTR